MPLLSPWIRTFLIALVGLSLLGLLILLRTSDGFGRRRRRLLWAVLAGAIVLGAALLATVSFRAVR